MIQPQTRISIVFCVLCILSSLWLFVQGYANLKSGKMTKYGFDAFWHLFDVQVRSFFKLRPSSKWNDPKRIRMTGIMAVLLAIILARTAARIFLEDILLYIK
jgi:hypothetical protein